MRAIGEDLAGVVNVLDEAGLELEIILEIRRIRGLAPAHLRDAADGPPAPPARHERRGGALVHCRLRRIAVVRADAHETPAADEEQASGGDDGARLLFYEGSSFDGRT